MKEPLLLSSRCIFPTPNMEQTAEYYKEFLGFRAVAFWDMEDPHIRLYRDLIEIVLLHTQNEVVIPNRNLYGYGYDAYFVTDHQAFLQCEFEKKGVNIVKRLSDTEYYNKDFVIEDIDGRWLGFGCKQN
jgi:catechol 2,3-dioxygenase-like lactoylglutathione lyase family enzyme